MKSNEFYNELKQLTELGYLEPPQLERIRAEYIQTRKESRNMLLLFSLLGVAFIGAGVISMFAYNWSMLSREVKAVLAFVPLLGIQALLYRKIQTQASEIWIKSLSLALGLAFLSGLGLIYQTYQISFDLQYMLLTGLLFMLPLVYLLDGYYLAFLYMGGICWTGVNSDYILLVFFLVPYYIKRVKSGKNCWLLSGCFFFWILYLAILYVPYYTFFACILILMMYMTVERPTLYPVLAGRLLYILLFIKTMFYESFEDLTQIFDYAGSHRSGYLPDILSLALLAAALGRLYIFCGKKSEAERKNVLLFSLVSGLLVLDLVFYADIQPVAFAYEILVNLSLIAFSLYRLMYGAKTANPASVRRYTASLILYTVMKVFSGHTQLLVKGLVFLIAGLVFLAVNYWMTLKLKGEDLNENTSE